jgi:hypothetical protein
VDSTADRHLRTDWERELVASHRFPLMGGKEAMNRLSRVAVLLSVAVGLLTSLAPALALADPIGGVLVIPGSGSDLDPIRLRTSAGCPSKATAYYAKMRGHGLPPDGQVITANTRAGMSYRAGFDVYVALIMRDYATDNHTTLGGRYDITVYCVNRLTLQSFGEFTGSLKFTSPTHYEALGEAKPVGTPPPPLEDADFGSAAAPDAALPSAGTSSAPGLPKAAAQAHSPLAAERSDTTGRSVPWLIAAGAVLVAGIMIVVANRIRKRRSL